MEINNEISFNVQTKVLPTKGNLVYEYNPFRNYRLTQIKYEYQEQLYTEQELEDNFDIIIDKRGTQWLKKTVIDNKEIYEPLTEDLPILHEKGELVDFITDELKFDLKHPVNIVPQYSYDGSVNLIINDGINTPKLINSRFSATGKNTYEIIDRKGNNDTNIYDQGDQFEIDTSLYKRVISIPKLSYEGTSSGGNLKVGNYHFYIKLSDADGNETDFVAESGLVSVFIGFGNPDSLTTGVKNQNSFKTVNLYMSNIDSAYDYLYVYYSRYTAEQGENFNTEYIKIDKKFVVSNQGTCNISINGYEPTIPITAADINDTFEIVDAVKAQVSCQNMLFLGNVHKPEIPYKELSDLSLHFLPYLKNKDYECKFDQNYNINTSSLGYWDSQYIYNYVGYWNNEFYRLGVVYILPNGELTPVFNIRGCSNVVEYKEPNKKVKKEETTDGENPDKKEDYSSLYTDIPLYINNERNYINYSETDYQLVANKVRDKDLKSTAINENIKGVIRFQSDKDADTIHSLDIRINDEAMQELKKYVKGFFFVRQTRIPTILAQGITLGLDQNSYTPTIPTAGGLLEQLSDSLDKTYVTTEDINDVNYVSEGFLSRYQFRFKKKSSSLWSKIGTIAAITAGVVALGAATVFTAGAAGALVAGSTLAGAVTAGSTALGGVLVAGGAVTTGLGLATGVAGASAIIAVGAGTAAGLITAAIATGQEVKYGIQTWQHKKLDGRNTKCPKGYKIAELDGSRKVGGDFENRIIIKDNSKNKTQVILCPDFEVNQAYFNQLFTGNEHLIESTKAQGNNLLLGHSSNYFSEDVINNYRHYYIPDYYDTNSSISGTYKLISVPEDVKCVGLDNLKFRSRAGYAEEAWQYESVGDEYKTENDKNNKSEADEETISNKQTNSDIVRGIYGAYLGVANTSDKLTPATTVNIYIPKYNSSNILKYIQIRMDDNSTYSAITDRIDISESDNYLVTKKSQLVNDSTDFYKDGYQFSAFRGDCYICQFTHRIIRNFNSPSAPYNDEIVDENTWKDNYNPSKTESYENINLGDVNAVQLGMWVTFRVRSSYNLNIRTLDSSNVDEKQMTGHARGYYPYAPMSVEGTYKIPESHIYNKGFSKSLSDRWNNLLPDVPYIKNWFGTRIMYSDIHINDAYKNGYRVFRKTRSVDYTREYGEITKLISLNSNLLIIFEHGIAVAPVNQATVQQTSGQLVATSKVLPEAPTVISDMFGSQWADSILKTPGKRGDSTQYVYGVDTVAKKIWKTDGNSLTCISDVKVQEFLNNNITLGERETTPILGVRNVKTCYNSYKGDVMFTFYDNTTGFQEKVWNLCYNELLDKFITFYSWVPSFMENINNIPFSFNRDTSKWIAKLGTSHSTSSFADGITLTNVVFDTTLDEKVVQNISVPINYLTKNGTYKTIYETVTTTSYFVGILQLSNRVIPNYNVPYDISYELCRDIYGNYKNFTLKKLKFYKDGHEQDTFPLSNVEDALFPTHNVSVYGLYLNPKSLGSTLLSELYYRNKEGHAYADIDVNKWEPNTKESLNVGQLIHTNAPIFKNLQGKREMLPKDKQINPDTIVKLLNIRATISATVPNTDQTLEDYYYNKIASYNVATYESTVAVIPKWNMQFLSTDFWKHGQAGSFDIADDIYPCYWYGKQHPFEFEFIVVNDPSVHKIFTNLELIANKAKPESFHYEVIGEAYDFAKDKPNMYFRQEAMKALWQYNGCDIEYNSDFLKIQTRQQNKSADLPHNYFARAKHINEVEDSYIMAQAGTHDYRHLSGGEIVYYPNRQEFRVWNHVPAVDVDDQSDTSASSFGGRGLMSSNMRYLEDRWKVQINPLLITYKNEYERKDPTKALCTLENSTWKDGAGTREGDKLPPLPLYNSPIPEVVKERGEIAIPGYSSSDSADYSETAEGKDNAMYNLYKVDFEKDIHPFDTSSWLDDVNIYKYNFGSAQNRKETDMRDKFIKIRIRYSGKELAIIDFINTIYQVSYA